MGKPSIEPNCSDGSYVTMTTDAVERHWGKSQTGLSGRWELDS